MLNKISGAVLFNDLREVKIFCINLVDYVDIGEGKKLTYVIFYINLDNWTTHSPNLKVNYPDILAICSQPQDMTVIFIWMFSNYVDKFD